MVERVWLEKTSKSKIQKDFKLQTSSLKLEQSPVARQRVP
jgi:hypothetical protein